MKKPTHLTLMKKLEPTADYHDVTVGDYQDVAIAVSPEGNLDTLQFRCWLPTSTPKAVVVLTPGSNQDGRMSVFEPAWRDFATEQNVALVGCYFADKEASWIETYVDVKQGSGAALLDALNQMGLGHLPLFLWGFSAGGEFNYEFACWLAPREPKRVLAFVVNKGGVYYSLLAPPETRAIPAIFFIGGKDAQFRQDVIHAIYSLNRVAECVWQEDIEHHAAHVIAFSESDTREFFAKELAKL